MKKKTLKRLVSLGLASCMLAGCGATAQTTETTAAKETAAATEAVKETAAPATEPEPSKYPEYLNLEDFRPIVKEGEEITLEIAVRRPSSAEDTILDNWFVKYVEEVLNIKLDITEITTDTLNEKKNLMFASGDIPDMMFDLNLTTAEIVQHGVEGGLLMPMNDYINEELTPNIVYNLETYPQAEKFSTASDGKMYTIASGGNNSKGYGASLGNSRVYYDTKFLEKVGVTELPDTLDEFIDLLRKFKAADPDLYPVIEASQYLELYLLSAFGFAVTPGGLSSEGALTPAWDEQENTLAIPALSEKYGEYLKVMNTLYTEGLIHPDYFTMDQVTARSYFTERKAAVMCDDTPYISVPEGWEDFTSAKPLASDWLDAGITTVGNEVLMGDVFIGADTEYPEVCMRLLDYLHSAEGAFYCRFGPIASDDEEARCGMIGFAGDGSYVYQDYEASNYGSEWEYSLAEVMLFFIDFMPYERGVYRGDVANVEWPTELDPTNPDYHARITNYENQSAGYVNPLPPTYMNSDQITTYTDLLSVLKNYVDAESAKFIVGQRSLDELGDFLNEVKGMGGDDYFALMQELYAGYER